MPAFETQRQLAIQWLDSQLPRMTQTLIRWCNQNSWSKNLAGLREMARILEQDFQTLSIPVQSISLPHWESIGDEGVTISHETGPLLLWHHKPTAARRILLAIHYDTVYPSLPIDAPAVHVQPDRLVGPGVADAKGGIAVIYFALQAILDFELAGDLGITVLLNPDEEIGSPSTTDRFAELAPQFEFALLFEPTLPDASLVANRKGSANFTVVVQGRAAHAGRNLADGRNAIVHAARLIAEVDSWNQSNPDISVNVGKVAGGGPLNQVPSLATVSMNVRVSTTTAAQDVISRMNSLERQFNTNEGFRCKILGQFHSPPKRIAGDLLFADLQQRITNSAARIGRVIRWRDTGGACDGNKFAAFGLSNVDTMGVTGGELHSSDEYCETASLLSATKTLVHLVADLGSEP